MDAPERKIEFVLSAHDAFVRENAPISASRMLALLPSARIWNVRSEPGLIVVAAGPADGGQAQDLADIVAAALACPSMAGWYIAEVRTVQAADGR
jgi:hypothetical protein